jgi:hypothetical protein
MRANWRSAWVFSLIALMTFGSAFAIGEYPLLPPPAEAGEETGRTIVTLPQLAIEIRTKKNYLRVRTMDDACLT